MIERHLPIIVLWQYHKFSLTIFAIAISARSFHRKQHVYYVCYVKIKTRYQSIRNMFSAVSFVSRHILFYSDHDDNWSRDLHTTISIVPLHSP